MRVYKEVLGTDNLPWEYDADAGCIDGRLRYVCDTGKKGNPVVLMNEDDAALAVHCVNNHEKLVEALWHAMQCWEYDGVSDEHGAVAMHCSELLAALEADKGGEL